MQHVTIFDCEYLTAPGAMARYWAGPCDPDPLVAQIGAVNLSLEGGFPVLGTFSMLIRPVDRTGAEVVPDPFFTELTGISSDDITTSGVCLAHALRQFDTFSEGARLWSWGKDELNLLGISCYAAGLKPPMAASRFGNAKTLMLRAGMTEDEIATTTSGQLAERFGIRRPGQRHHDARDDAESIALALQHLLKTGRLIPRDFCQ